MTGEGDSTSEVIAVPSSQHRLLAAAGVVGALFLVSPRQVPLYDGVGFPDQPYRYVVPPAGSTGTPPPTAAHGRLKLVKGSNADFLTVASTELGPQVLVDVPPAALTVTGAATYVDVQARPTRATAPPADGIPDSNVYDVSLTSPAGPVTVLPSGEGIQLTLRAIRGAPPDPVMEYRATPSEPWQHLTTGQNGQDTYAAVLRGTGQFLLVQPKAATTAAAGRSSSHRALYGTVAALVVGLLVALLGIRLLARKPTP